MVGMGSVDMSAILNAIRERKAEHGSDLVVLGHLYVNAEVLKTADLVGDSYGLSLEASRSAARYIVFCGVHFMAESARILCKPEQRVFIPDSRAGCPMADMVTERQFSESMEQLTASLGDPPYPVVYVNSTAEVKALVGRAGGTCCTSSNARVIVESILEQGRRVFFLPDRNLGWNVARSLDVPEERIAFAGRRGQEVSPDARIVLWPGYCPIHERFTHEDVQAARTQSPGCRVLVHPECTPEVVEASDFSGSTSQLLTEVQSARSGAVLYIGTETNFVIRAQTLEPDARVVPLRESRCRNMAKMNVENLLATLQEVGSSKPASEVMVPSEIARDARLALERMIRFVEGRK